MSESEAVPRPGGGQRGTEARRRRRRRAQRARLEPRQQLSVEAADAAIAGEALRLSTPDEGGPNGAVSGARCPICGLVIRNLYSAITEQESQQPAHFDCVLRQLSAAEELAEGERVAYLGAGIFGVIQLRRQQRTRARGRRSSSSPALLSIRKRIKYEETEPVAEWRQSLALCAPGTVFVQMRTPPTDSRTTEIASDQPVD